MWVCSLKNKWKHVNTFPFQLFDAITQGEITRGRVLEWSPNCSPFVVGWGFCCCSRKEILKWVNITENKASCLTVDYFTYLYQIKPIWCFFQISLELCMRCSLLKLCLISCPSFPLIQIVPVVLTTILYYLHNFFLYSSRWQLFGNTSAYIYWLREDKQPVLSITVSHSRM